MLFGTNDFNAPVPGQTVQRTYHTPQQDIPQAWDKQTPPGVLALDSIRPSIAEVAAGKLDDELLSYWRTLPERSLVTLWHEANDPKHGLDPATMKAAHAHCAELVAGSDVEVYYGAVFVTYPLWHDRESLGPWLPNLGPRGWVGADSYLHKWNAPGTTPATLFDAFTADTYLFSQPSRRLVVETNVTTNLAVQQGEWFDAIVDYAVTNHYAGVMPWAGDPQQFPTIQPLTPELLAHIAARCAVTGIAHA